MIGPTAQWIAATVAALPISLGSGLLLLRVDEWLCQREADRAAAAEPRRRAPRRRRRRRA